MVLCPLVFSSSNLRSFVISVLLLFLQRSVFYWLHLGFFYFSFSIYKFLFLHVIYMYNLSIFIIYILYICVVYWLSHPSNPYIYILIMKISNTIKDKNISSLSSTVLGLKTCVGGGRYCILSHSSSAHQGGVSLSLIFSNLTILCLDGVFLTLVYIGDRFLGSAG